MMRSPGRRPPSVTTRVVRATPAVLMTMPSTSPRPITLVSPVRTAVPASRQASRIDARIRSRSRRGNPSSMITLHVSPSTSVAPIIARSFTVPDTASRPMSPPGKNGGWITWESVVRTSHWSPMRTAAPSSIAARPMTPAGWAGSVSNACRNASSMRRRIARPPAPCFIMMRSSETSVTRHLPAAPDRARRRTGARCGTSLRC